MKGFINQVREIKEKERMIFLANMQREIEQKKEQVEMETASKFYENNIKDKFKMFYLILKTQSLNTYMKYNKIKRILVNSFTKRIFYSLKQQTKLSIQRDNEIINKFKIRNIFIKRKHFFYRLYGYHKETKENKEKEDIINKLKSKAQMLLGDFK